MSGPSKFKLISISTKHLINILQQFRKSSTRPLESGTGGGGVGQVKERLFSIYSVIDYICPAWSCPRYPQAYKFLTYKCCLYQYILLICLNAARLYCGHPLDSSGQEIDLGSLFSARSSVCFHQIFEHSGCYVSNKYDISSNSAFLYLLFIL